MFHIPLHLAVDMYGCPNRCRHCWLGRIPDRIMEKDADTWLINYFKQDFSSIVFYSWLREPDYCGSYQARWRRDCELSIGQKPERFELASVWRLVRDPDYAPFLRETGVKRVQLTFFGLEALTDKFTGRNGAWRELLQATEILLRHEIAPRWQVFINEENKHEIPALLDLSRTLDLEKRCRSFGEPFRFFIHAGSCDGENRKLYPIRIEKKHIPEILKPYYLQFDQVLTEAECCAKLMGCPSHEVPHNQDRIVLLISSSYDVYFNFTHMSNAWKIGNLKTSPRPELIRRIVEEDTPALNLARHITLGELAEQYGDPASEKAFFPEDYQIYLLNRFLEDRLG